MKVLNATYSLSTVITEDTSNIAVSCNSVTFENKGTADAFINTTYKLESGQALTLKNDPRTIITSTFNITFGTTGTKQVNIIKETVS